MDKHMMQYALQLAQSGFAVLPTKPGTKRPIANWAEYQTKAPTSGQLKIWYMNGATTSLGIITGKVSGNLEVIDFDDMDMYKKAVAWLRDDPQAAAIMDMITKVEEQTPNGMHWYYRIHNNCYPNTKLVQTRQADGSLKCTIETRGEGGYIVAAPTILGQDKKYLLTRGQNHSEIVTITSTQRNTLMNRIKMLSDVAEVQKQQPSEIFVAPEGLTSRPGDAFEQQKSWEEILSPHGWTIFHVQGEITQWCKPNASERHCHATTGKTQGLYVFSSNAYPFEPNKSYSKFAAYTYLEHNGDFEKSASELAKDGYGQDNLHRWGEVLNPTMPIAERLNIKSGVELKDIDTPPAQYVCYDILPEGLVVLAGAPKIGKSLFALDLCMSVSGEGRKFLGRYDVPDDASCLYFALEDNVRRLKARALAFEDSQPSWSDAKHVLTERFKWSVQHPPSLDKGLCNLISEYLKAEPKCRLIVIDVYNSIKPMSSRSGGNAYEVDAKQADALQQLAIAHHCCILVITHLRKTSAYSSSDPFEEITGSMGLPSKADTIIVFKKGTNTNEGKLYIRGRETKEQTIDVDFVDGLWYVREENTNDYSQLKYYTDFEEYFEETGKSAVTPGDFAVWYQKRTGSKMSNASMALKRLYERDAIERKNGKYMPRRKQ